LILPALKTLEIRGYNKVDDVFSRLSSQPILLEHLSISRSVLSSACLVEFVSNAHHLTHLELTSLSAGTNSVLEALATPISNAGPVVRLVKLRLTASKDAPGEADKTPARILSLVLDGCERIDVEWVSWLRQKVPFVSCIYQTKKKAAWKR